MFNEIFRSIKNKPISIWGIWLFLLFTFLDLFFLKMNSDFWYFIFIVIWVYFNQKNKIEGKVSVFLALIFLSLSPLFMFFSQDLAQRSAIWAFLLLSTAVILIFKENKSE
jgi:hypothetical protein